MRAVDLEHARQLRRRRARVSHFARHRERRLDLDRDRELAAARVVDRAARRIELDDALLLALGAAREFVVAVHLEVVETAGDRSDPEREQGENPEEAALHSISSRKITCSSRGASRPSSSLARVARRSGIGEIGRLEPQLALDLLELMGSPLQGLDPVADAQRLELQPGVDHETQRERKDREQHRAPIHAASGGRVPVTRYALTTGRWTV